MSLGILSCASQEHAGRAAGPGASASAASPSRQAVAPPSPAVVATDREILRIDEKGKVKVLCRASEIRDLEREADGEIYFVSSESVGRVTETSCQPIASAPDVEYKRLVLSSPSSIWAFAPTSFVHYDAKDWRRTDASAVFKNTAMRIADVAIDEIGNVWLAAGEQGLFRFDGFAWKPFTLLPDTQPMRLSPSPSGGVWVAGRGRIEHVTPSSVERLYTHARPTSIVSYDLGRDGSWVFVGTDPDTTGNDASRYVAQWGRGKEELGRYRLPGGFWPLLALVVDGKDRAWMASPGKLIVAPAGEGEETSLSLDGLEGTRFIGVAVPGAGPSTLPKQLATPGPRAPEVSATATAAPSAEVAPEKGSTQAIIAKVQALQPKFVACRPDPSMEGSMKVVAALDAKGRVVSAVPSGGKGLSPEVMACIAARVRETVFDPPNGGATTLEIPIRLVARSPSVVTP